MIHRAPCFSSHESVLQILVCKNKRGFSGTTLSPGLKLYTLSLWMCEWVLGWGGKGGLLILSVAAAPLIPVPQRCPNFTLLCEPNYLHLPFFFPSPLVVRDFRDSIHVLRATLSRTNTQTHMYRPHKAKQLEPCEWSNWDHWLRSFTSCRPKVLVMVHVNGQGACKDNK